MDELDRIYSGFLPNPALDIPIAVPATGAVKATAATPQTWTRGGLSSRAAAGNETGKQQAMIVARPSTAVRPVGYTADGRGVLASGQRSFITKKTIVTEPKRDESPERKFKNMETKIHKLIEEAILLASSPIGGATSTGTSSSTAVMPSVNVEAALAKAKEASACDRRLLRMRDQNHHRHAASPATSATGGGGGGNIGGGSSATFGVANVTYIHNFDLTFSVLFTLATLYAANDMYVESLNTYSIMTRNKMFSNANRLKINMGNIYYHLGYYQKAIKMYRMALDQVPVNQKELRLKVTHNIGVLFIKMGQYSDAATSFEFIMAENGDFRSGLHLVLCYYALGDRKKMRRAFQLLLDVHDDFNLESRETNTIDDANSDADYVYTTILGDELAQFERHRRSAAHRCILMAANLIAPIIDESFADGYAWCVDTIKASAYPTLAAELDLNKAVWFLKQNDPTQALETLRYFEKREPAVAVNALTNLTFIHLTRGEIEAAAKTARQAKAIDSYNPAVLINAGVVAMHEPGPADAYETARSLFASALDLDATSFEALYNFGLCAKRAGDADAALSAYRKLAASLHHEPHAQVIYQMGAAYELATDRTGALEWYEQVSGIEQLDPGVMSKIGDMHEVDMERQQAFHYYMESYRLYPANLALINWLGVHFIELQVAERACSFYERATIVRPDDAYFLLRVAACMRRMGNAQNAWRLFEAINVQHPDNLDCLKALVHLARAQAMDEQAEKYRLEAERVRKVRDTRQRVGSSNSRPTTGRLLRSNSSARSSAHDSPTSSRKSGQQLSQQQQQQQHSATGGSGRLETISQASPVSSSRPASITVAPYQDPLGPAPERPRTGRPTRQTTNNSDSDDDLNPEMLLPI